MDWTPVIDSVLEVLIRIIVMVALGYGTVLLKRWFTEEQLKRFKEVALDVANFVEQYMKKTNLDLKLEERFNMAKQHLVEEANKRGLKLTEEQLERYIDVAVREMNMYRDITGANSDNSVTVATKTEN